MTPLEKNNVAVRGADGGDPIVFVHGYGCDQTMWRDVAAAFQASHRIVLYDLTGMGRSAAATYDFDVYSALGRHGDDLVDILEHLDLHDCVVVGHSVGATIAALATLKAADRISAIALVSPSPCFMNDGDYTGGFDRDSLTGLVDLMEQNYLGWTDRVAPTIAGRDGEHGKTVELAQSFCRTDPAIARHFGRVTFLSDHRDDMRRVPVPALVIQCSDDALAPVAVGEWLDGNMERATLTVIDAHGHCPHMTEPDKVTGALMAFLAGHAA